MDEIKQQAFAELQSGCHLITRQSFEAIYGTQTFKELVSDKTSRFKGKVLKLNRQNTMVDLNIFQEWYRQRAERV